MRTLTRREVALALSSVLGVARSWLATRGFVEVITPHLTPFPTEDARTAFAVTYLDRTAYLGQSRRRYHQLLLAGLPRVFEIGPIYWADPAIDGYGLTQCTAIEFTRTHLENNPDPESELHTAEQLLAELATAVDAVLPLPAKPAWTRSETIPVGLPFPVSQETQHVLACHDRPVAMTTCHRQASDTARHESEIAALQADPKLAEPFIEGVRFGIPEHAAHTVVVEHLLTSLLGRTDLRELCLFPRDAETTTP